MKTAPNGGSGASQWDSPRNPLPGPPMREEGTNIAAFLTGKIVVSLASASGVAWRSGE